MRKGLEIIRVVFVQSAIARAAFSIIAFFFLVSSASSQSKLDSIFDKLDPQKFAASISKKTEKLEDKLVNKSMKVLDKLQSQEEKIYCKLLHTTDSLQAKVKLAEVKDKYTTLKNNLKNPALVSKARQFIPKLDSLNTSLKFLNENGIGGKVKDALTKTTALQDKFQQAEEIKKFIRERRELLKLQLEKLGIVKQLKKISKSYYYYAATISEYKNILKNPKQIEKKALELLSKTKMWKDFFRKNSMLASLFRIPNPDEPVNMASLAGLQTRAQVNALIQQTVTGTGPNGMQQFRQNLQAGQSQLNELKAKIGKFGGSSSDDIMPEGFRPNSEKTKSLLKRLVYSANIQTQKATGYFVTTSDIGLSAGFKLNDKSIIGIGGSYKLGLGRGWQHIKLSSEGLGLRSFIDWKIKENFWISGGYEMNYKTAFRNFYQLKDLSAWQRSGLIGTSKSMPIKSKFFKKTKLQVLWDFLSYEQRPRTQPFVFRTGYNF